MYLFLRASLILDTTGTSDTKVSFYDSMKILLSMINKLFVSIYLTHVFATIKFAAEQLSDLKGKTHNLQFFGGMTKRRNQLDFAKSTF